MKKKIFATGLCLMLIVCVLVGCGYGNKDNKSTGEFENTTTDSTKEEKQNDDTKESSSGNIEEGDYKNAISDDELNDAFKTVTEYYQNKLSWEVMDYRIADNAHSFYPLYQDYKLGNIIVFEVHTTDNPSGLYRSIALGRKTDTAKWEVLNEGV